MRAKCHQRCPPRAVLRRRALVIPRGVVDATIRVRAIGGDEKRRRRLVLRRRRVRRERSAGVAPFGNRGEMTGRGRGVAGGVTRPPRTRGGGGRRTRGDGGGGGSRSRDGGRRESLLLLASLLLRAFGPDLADEVLHALHGLLGLGFSPALLHGASQLELRAVVRARGRRRGRAGGVAIGPRAGPGGALGVRDTCGVAHRGVERARRVGGVSPGRRAPRRSGRDGRCPSPRELHDATRARGGRRRTSSTRRARAADDARRFL